MTYIAKSVRAIGGIKAYIALVFCGEVMLYTAIRQWLLGEAALPYSMIWQFLAIAVFTTIIQAVCFGDYFFKKLRGSLRLALFTVKMFCMLSLFAWFFGWFPTDNPWAWLTFGGIFLISELAIAGAMEMYYRITGEQYTAKLQLYKQSTADKG